MVANSRQAAEVVKEVLEDLQDDPIAQIFIYQAILCFAEDVSKKNPDHIYHGFIPGKKYVDVAQQILGKIQDLERL